jgi:hypothetical protein
VRVVALSEEPFAVDQVKRGALAGGVEGWVRGLQQVHGGVGNRCLGVEAGSGDEGEQQRDSGWQRKKECGDGLARAVCQGVLLRGLGQRGCLQP